MSSVVQTVTGPVDPAELGYTLPHEHIYIALGLTDQRFDYPDLLDDDDVLTDELTAFKDQGGTCIVEATQAGVGRSPERLRAISERTGLSVVMGCGWYRAPYYPAADSVDRRSADSLAEQLVAEIEDGVGTTGIRPGVIGEIGAHAAWIAPIEERAHRAVARAQKQTGLPILTHSAFRTIGLDQLKLFEEEGVDPSRVAIGHADSYPMMDFYLEIIRRGASVMLDNMGIKPWGRHEERIIRYICDLVDRGFTDRIMLSQDVCKIPHLRYHGGNGYTYIHDTFIPMLLDAGIPMDAVATMVIDNPRRWLTIER